MKGDRSLPLMPEFIAISSVAIMLWYKISVAIAKIAFLTFKMETLLLAIVIILQLVLIFLILQRREYRLLPEGLVVPDQPKSLQEKTNQANVSSENLWDNPPPASEELKLTVAEFKNKYDRSEPWDGDFVL